MQTLTIPPSHMPFLRLVSGVLQDHGVAAWLVGGYVRDVLLGQPSADIDLAVDGPAVKIARALADKTGGAFVMLDDATETARVVWSIFADESDPPWLESRLIIDLVRLRAPTIDADLRLRDVTINALALPLAQAMQTHVPVDALLDPLGGQRDLELGQVRVCGPTSLSHDPLRMVRVVRFAAQFGFGVVPETDALLRQHAVRITEVAAERVREELLKLVGVPRAAPWIAYLDDVGLLTRIIPELEAARGCEQPEEHFFPVREHLLEAVGAWEWLYREMVAQVKGTQAGQPLDPQRPFALPSGVAAYPDLAVTLPYVDRIMERMEEVVLSGHRRYAVFKLAVLLHDVAKPATKRIQPNGRITFYDHQEQGGNVVAEIGARLRLSRETIAYLRLVVEEHMRPGQLRALGAQLSRRAVYRLLRDAGDAAPDVLLHSLCDHLAARGPRVSVTAWQQHLAWTGMVLDLVWGEQQVARRVRLITGDDVVRGLGVAPGPRVGQILAAVGEAHFLGEIQTRDEALVLAAQLAQAKQPD